MKKISFYSVMIILLGLILNSCDKKEYESATIYVYEGLMYIHEYRDAPGPNVDTFNIYDTIAYTAVVDWSNEEFIEITHYPTDNQDDKTYYQFNPDDGNYGADGYFYFLIGGQAYFNYFGITLPSKKTYRHISGSNRSAGITINFDAELVRSY